MTQIVPTTEEQAKEMIQAIVEFVFKDKDIKSRNAYIKDYMARPMDIVLSKGYNEDANAGVIFCIKGSPNRMYGFARRVKPRVAGMNNLVEGMLVTTDFGDFLDTKIMYEKLIKQTLKENEKLLE